MFNGGHIIQRATGISLSSAGLTFELNQSEWAVRTQIIIEITSPSSLSAGFVKLEQFSPNTNTWIAAPQTVYLIASGGGTPGVISGNTASATAITGGSASNVTGITALTNTATISITTNGLGTRQRLSIGATSGTATLAYAFLGVRQFGK